MIDELCPHCEEEVEIKAGFIRQNCPNCDKPILPCTLCDNNEINCGDCLVEEKVKTEQCLISENDLKKMVKGKDDDYMIHFYTEEGTEVEISKGITDDVLEGL